MRKTVHEWLETHDRGRQMEKKRRKNGSPANAEGQPVARKKRVKKKVKRRPK